MSDRLLSQPLFLCGMMGSGKTTIGKKLADKLQVPFSDLDSIIEKEAGKPIPEIFRVDGEESFRKLEKSVLTRYSQMAEGVVALGGGALQNQMITDHLKLQGWLVFLNCDTHTLVQRLKSSMGRPMIKNLNEKELTEKIQKLNKERLKYYNQAHFSVDSGRQPVKKTVEELIQKLKIYEQKHTG